MLPIRQHCMLPVAPLQLSTSNNTPWHMLQVALVALLPAVPRWAVVGPTNEAWAALAACKGLPFIRCGQELDPTDTSLFTDGLHQTDAGRELLASCLRAAVDPLLQQQQQRQG